MKVKKCIAGMLSLAMLLTGIGAYAPTAVLAAQKGPTELPGTTRTMKQGFDASFLSVTGFAADPTYGVHDRTDAIGTDRYRTVKTEDEFLQALVDAKRNKVDVIEIASDLNLGWNELSEEAKASGVINQYGWDIRTITLCNPSIIESGVSQLTISDTKGLTIFSKGGNTVRHAEWKLQGTSSDIVIRNIEFDDLWTFPEMEDKDDDTKALGWSPLKINGAKGVWIDHCSVRQGYDGCMDSENGASYITASWNQFSSDATEQPSTNSMIYRTITYLETARQMGMLSDKGYYSRLRSSGATPEQIMAYEAFHNKFNLNGAGDKDFTDGKGLEDGNQRLHMTFAYNRVTNIGQRFPLLRQGTVHYVNDVLDNSGHVAAAKAIGKSGGNTGISARNGASVGVDTCVYKDVSRVISCKEKNNMNALGNTTEEYQVAFTDALNHVLIVNSSTTIGKNTYTGSSWDNDGINPFTTNFGSSTDFWNDNKSTLGSFKWFSHIVGVENYTRAVPPKDENGNYIPFKFTYDDNLGYDYQAFPLDQVETTVKNNCGAYTYNQDASFWLRTSYTAEEKFAPVSKDTVVKTEELEISDDALELRVNDLRQLTVEFQPAHVTTKEVTWTSSNPDVVEVKDSGLLVAKSEGSATVRATTKDGTNLTKSCEVTVGIPVESIEIDAPDKYLYVGDETTAPESLKFKAVITPSNATNKGVIWSSQNPMIATVDENGVVTAVAKGSVKIVCTSVDNPDISAFIRISVKNGVNPNPRPTETPEPTEAPTPTETPAPTETPIVYGDVTGEGNVEAADALEVLKYVVKLKALDEKQLKAADVTGDGNVDANDALDILKHVVKLLDKFKVEN